MSVVPLKKSVNITEIGLLSKYFDVLFLKYFWLASMFYYLFLCCFEAVENKNVLYFFQCSRYYWRLPTIQIVTRILEIAPPSSILDPSNYLRSFNPEFLILPADFFFTRIEFFTSFHSTCLKYRRFFCFIVTISSVFLLILHTVPINTSLHLSFFNALYYE